MRFLGGSRWRFEGGGRGVDFVEASNLRCVLFFTVSCPRVLPCMHNAASARHCLGEPPCVWKQLFDGSSWGSTWRTQEWYTAFSVIVTLSLSSPFSVFALPGFHNVRSASHPGGIVRPSGNVPWGSHGTGLAAAAHEWHWNGSRQSLFPTFCLFAALFVPLSASYCSTIPLLGPTWKSSRTGRERAAVID